MKKNAPTMREVEAARATLSRKASEMAKAKAGRKPSYEEDRAWRQRHPSPIDRWEKKHEEAKRANNERAEEILLAGHMGQMTSEEFYAAVKAF